ncbi:MAG: UbiA family prenyltransferase, partial [Pseudomonadota bacterium]|nr:UbiA family prenyltransferase [Pseudomonadota bacterium]
GFDQQVEALVFSFFRHPLRTLQTLARLWRKQHVLKRRLIRFDNGELDTLPVNKDLLRYLRSRKKAGARLVLVTASPYRIACIIAERIGLFDEVFASRGLTNLKGKEKARLLVERFGRGGYIYCGNSREDLPVWAEAAAAIPVNAPRTVMRSISCPVKRAFVRKDYLKVVLCAMRPHQWMKNTLMFVPLATAGLLDRPDKIALLVLAWIAFCAMASATYQLNNIVDLHADRAHRTKRNRPMASGRMTIPEGMLLGVVLAVLAVVLGGAVSAAFLGIMVIYAIASTLYSFRLKRVPLVDVAFLSLLFTWRIVAGAVVVDVPLSPWLIFFSLLIFLSLAIAKRIIELGRAGRGKASIPGRILGARGYRAEDARILLHLGVPASFSSIVILCLDVALGAGEGIYTHPQYLWGIVALFTFWVCYFWFSLMRDDVSDDPVLFALKDRASQFVIVLMLVIQVLALYC